MSLETDEIDIKAELDKLLKSVNESVDKKMEKFADLADQLEKIEMRLNRKGLAGGDIIGAGGFDASTETKSFCDFMRTGSMEIKSMMAGSGPDGGYMVPSQLAEQIENLELKQSAMRQLARVVPVTVANFSQLVNKHGAGSGWVNETSQRPNTATPNLGLVNFNDCEVYANPLITQRLLDDAAYNVDAWLTQELADTFTDQEGDAFINGNTPTRPTGFLQLTNAPVSTSDATRALGTLQYIPTGDANGFAATSPGDALIDLVQSVKPKYRQNGAWLMNPKTVGTIRKIKDTVGRYLFQESLVVGQPPTLLGYPVYEDDHMPDTGANNFPIAFGDFRRGYYILDRQLIRVLRDPFTTKGWVAFYSTKRLSGNVVNSEAIKLLKCAVS